MRLLASVVTACVGLATAIPAAEPKPLPDLFARFSMQDTTRHIDQDWPDIDEGGGYAIYRLRREANVPRAEWSVLETSHPPIAERRLRAHADRLLFSADDGARPQAAEGVFVDVRAWPIPSGFVPPKPRFRGAPRYPTDLMLRGFPGTVEFEFVVLPDGSVGSMEVLRSTHPTFAIAVARALRHWRYEPATWQGRRAAAIMRQPVSFALENSSAREPDLGGYPAEPADRARYTGGTAWSKPRIMAVSEIPYPAEAWPGERPKTIEPLIVTDETGRVVETDPGLEEPWRDATAAVLEAWRFTEATLEYRKVPWAFRVTVDFDDDRSMLRRAITGEPDDVITDPHRHPPLLVAFTLPWNRPEGSAPGPRKAVVDLLVDATGRVRATRLVETDDPAFARFARALAAFAVYDRDGWRARRGAVWLRRTWTSD